VVGMLFYWETGVGFGCDPYYAVEQWASYMNFKCPNCERWFVDKSALEQHLVDSHQMIPGFQLTGEREQTNIVHATHEQRHPSERDC
jgi:hypothetical protein